MSTVWADGVAFDGQTYTVVDEDCTVNITEDLSQHETLFIKSGTVTINGSGHTLTAEDKDN